jgi:hypothetical protein
VGFVHELFFISLDMCKGLLAHLYKVNMNFIFRTFMGLDFFIMSN